jgi:hypothetical protein
LGRTTWGLWEPSPLKLALTTLSLFLYLLMRRHRPTGSCSRF